MDEVFSKTRVLILVMTYPHPSRGYQELVCTAGITENLEWVRLYPVDYRYRPKNQRFQKYQWVNINLASRGKGNDNRKESRKPDLESIRLIGEPLSSKNNWLERRLIVEKLPIHTIHELRRLYDSDKTSLGIIRPKRIIDLVIEEDDEVWKPQWQELYSQLTLFGPTPKPLAKIPYKFSYIFECDDDEKSHQAMIEDWELGVLYLKEAARLGNKEKAAESVRKKYFDDICATDKDTHFFMGTTFPYNSWVVLGTYYPKKEYQLTLGF